MSPTVELIFIPTPGVSHLVPILEFALRLLDRDPCRLSATVLNIRAPFPPYLDTYTQAILSSSQHLARITLIDLPSVDPPPHHELLSKSIEHLATTYIDSHVPHVREILSGRSNSNSNSVVVIDLFCVSMIHVAKEFSLPSYIYLTTNSGFLGLMFELLNHHVRIGREFSFSPSSNHPDELSVPSFSNPVPVSVLPGALFDGARGGYSAYIKIAQGFKDCDGILVNTFEDLEPYDFSSILNNQQVPVCVYKVGPVIRLESLPHPDLDSVRWDGIWKWLDDQPPSSVLFLCFGSTGTIGDAQAGEIAAALERSGKSFLWSLRVEGSSDHEKILPGGFQERTKERGVVCGWVPQVEVLAHRAIGGFISHCGWNSILESLWHGVPIVTWPKGAEQQLNAYLMAKELKLAVELRLDYRDGSQQIVKADEIGRAVARLMNEDEMVIEEKAKGIKDLARKALKEGGTSFVDMGRFIENIIETTKI